MIPVTDQAYKLFHQGQIALAQVEANGMKIDVDYLKTMIAKTKRKINHLTNNLKKDKIYKVWKKQYGTKFNLDSGMQLGKILFDTMNYTCKFRTKTGIPVTDEAALSQLEIPFITDLISLGKLKKARGTYLKGILRETTEDGFLHPFFGLNLARTMRGQSDHPNFQNIPIRNPETAELIRSAFITRKNHRIIEADYSGAEISAATCYHKDPNMISYIKDPTKDLHRDMAAQIYMLRTKEVSKEVRYCGKNKFIFPQFYGDWYLSCAKSLWVAIEEMNLCAGDGLNLYDHLLYKGIKKLGACNPKERPKKHTFELHLKEIEDDFWHNRFQDYGQWKLDWWNDYVKNGFFTSLTGFRIDGLMNRKEVINYPIQGTAFHWLLWSLIRIQKLLNKYNMRSKIVGQIHDSIVADVHRKEKRNYLEIAKQVMTLDIRKHYKWINVPLTIDAEITPINGNWYQKKEIII